MKHIGFAIATVTIVAALGAPAAASSSQGKLVKANGPLGYYEPAGPVGDLPSRLEQTHLPGAKWIAM